MFSMFALMSSCWSVQQPCAAKKRLASTLPTAHFSQNLDTQPLGDSARSAQRSALQRASTRQRGGIFGSEG